MSGVLLDPRLKRLSSTWATGRQRTAVDAKCAVSLVCTGSETAEIEFYRLEMQLQMQLLSQINLLSEFIVENFPTDKINIGMIGNMVSQLHVHVVGRNREDSCWPGVVWGAQQFRPYETGEVVKNSREVNILNAWSVSADPQLSP